jgi:hypothetical protein
MRRGKQAGGRAGQQRINGKETAGVNRHGHRHCGGRTDDLTGLRAATLPSPARKTGPAMKKEAENPIYE